MSLFKLAYRSKN